MAKYVAYTLEEDAIAARIFINLLHTLDEKAKECNISRNELINQMILFALANMENTTTEK